MLDQFNRPFKPLYFALCAGLVVAGDTAWFTGSAWPMLWIAVLALIVALRIGVGRSYERARARDPSGKVQSFDIGLWETRFGLMMILHGGMWGVLCCGVLSWTDDGVLQMIAASATITVAVGGAVRQGALPQAGFLMLLVMIVPTAVVCLLRGQTQYVIYAGEMILCLAGMHTLLVQSSVAANSLLNLNEDRRALGQAFDAALTHMAQGLCVFDPALRLIAVNERFRGLFGLRADDLPPGTPLTAIVMYANARGTGSGADPAQIAADYVRRLQSGEPQTHLARMVNGRFLLMKSQATPDGGCVITFDDVTERESQSQQMREMALTDFLTGLANRARFDVAFADHLAAAQASGGQLAVIALDLDRFKLVNDAHGHAVGDALLRAVAGRLRAMVRDGDLVARLGGDEFVILVQGGRAEADEIASRMVADLAEPYIIEGLRLTIGASAGIALAPGDGLVGDHLLRLADYALYAAKAARGMYCFHADLRPAPQVATSVTIPAGFAQDLAPDLAAVA